MWRLASNVPEQPTNRARVGADRRIGLGRSAIPPRTWRCVQTADTASDVAESAASRCSAHTTVGARADAAAIDVSRKKWRRDGAELIASFIVQPLELVASHQVGT